METSRIALAREKYKPEKVNLLLIGEAPPTLERFFYFENVPSADFLFVRLVLAVCDKFVGIDNIRAKKREILETFKNWGLFLMDLCDCPIRSYEKGQTEYDRLGLKESFMSKIRNEAAIVKSETEIIIVAASVYDYIRDDLVKNNYKVSGHRVWFPAYRKVNGRVVVDHREMFCKQMKVALKETDLNVAELRRNLLEIVGV